MWRHLISSTGTWAKNSTRFVKANFPCFPPYLQVFLSQGHSHPGKSSRVLSCHSCIPQLKLFLPWYSKGQFKAIFQHAIVPVRSVMVTKNILVLGTQFKSRIWVLQGLVYKVMKGGSVTVISVERCLCGGTVDVTWHTFWRFQQAAPGVKQWSPQCW